MKGAHATAVTDDLRLEKRSARVREAREGESSARSCVGWAQSPCCHLAIVLECARTHVCPAQISEEFVQYNTYNTYEYDPHINNLFTRINKLINLRIENWKLEWNCESESESESERSRSSVM